MPSTDLYRISVTVLAGPHESDICFQEYMAQPGATVVYAVSEPGQPNRVFYIWKQTGALTKPSSCTEFHTPDLLTDGGKNGWPTLAEAGKVLEKHVGKLQDIEDMVAKAQVEAAVTGVPKAVLGGAKELVTDAAEVVDKAADVTPTWVKVGVGIGSLALLGYAVRSFRR